MKSFKTIFLLLFATHFFIGGLTASKPGIATEVSFSSTADCDCNNNIFVGGRFFPPLASPATTTTRQRVKNSFNSVVGEGSHKYGTHTGSSIKTQPYFGLCGGTYRWFIHVNSPNHPSKDTTTSGTISLPGGAIPADVHITGNASPYPCGSQVTLTGHTSTQGPNLSYLWTEPDNIHTHTGQSVTFTADNSTAGTWKLVVSTENLGVTCSIPVPVTTDVVVGPMELSATADCFGNVTVSGTAPAGEMVTINENGNFLGTLTANNNGTFSGTFFLSPGTYIISASSPNCTGASVTLIVAPADLAIAKTVRQCSHDHAIFTVTVTNNGPCPAENVTINDVLPEGITLKEVSGENWTISSNGQFITAVYTASLAEGATTTPLIIKTCFKCHGNEILVNNARVSSSSPDLNPSNNTAVAAVACCTRK